MRIYEKLDRTYEKPILLQIIMLCCISLLTDWRFTVYSFKLQGVLIFLCISFLCILSQWSVWSYADLVSGFRRMGLWQGGGPPSTPPLRSTLWKRRRETLVHGKSIWSVVLLMNEPLGPIKYYKLKYRKITNLIILRVNYHSTVFLSFL